MELALAQVVSFLSRPPYVFSNDTATPEIYTLSLHDALPISAAAMVEAARRQPFGKLPKEAKQWVSKLRSEEHTSELQSHSDLVCRLLLEKKKTRKTQTNRSEAETIVRTAHRGAAH